MTMRPLARRTVLRAAALGGLAVPTLLRADRPVLTHGVQSGDVLPGSGLVWTRADRRSRMEVEVADNRSSAAPAASVARS